MSETVKHDPNLAPVETPLHRFMSDYSDSAIAMVALAVLLVIVFIALFAPFISPTDPYDLAKVSIFDGKLPPGSVSVDGVTFWLGTDGAGRDGRRRNVRCDRTLCRQFDRLDGRLLRWPGGYHDHADRRYSVVVPGDFGGTDFDCGAGQRCRQSHHGDYLGISKFHLLPFASTLNALEIEPCSSPCGPE